jgi:23S rRNA (adenine2503-C2)-methyltransferase
MTSLLFDKEQIEPRLKEHKIPNFRLKQIFHEIFKNQNIEWDEMTTLSKELRSDLSSFFSPLALEIETTVETDETTKFGFKTEDGHLIESVIMYHWQDEKYQKGENRKLNRITICVSSQVGCPVNCLFCVTGKLGFTRNLTWQEILSQVIYANAYLKKKFGKREDGTLRGVRNVVFMGMGEPLLNYENVKKSCEMLLSQEYFSLGRRHVTISTS